LRTRLRTDYKFPADADGVCVKTAVICELIVRSNGRSVFLHEAWGLAGSVYPCQISVRCVRIVPVVSDANKVKNSVVSPLSHVHKVEPAVHTQPVPRNTVFTFAIPLHKRRSLRDTSARVCTQTLRVCHLCRNASISVLHPSTLAEV
jgi:hypothetical protein